MKDIEELLEKYRYMRRESLKRISANDTDQTIGFWNGQIAALEMVIEDLRGIVLKPTTT